MTQFIPLSAGALSLVARDTLGYAVGPLKTPALVAGKNYTVIVVGNYPAYRALAFEEPADTGDAELSLYEMSPAVRSADFGSFQASSNSGYRRLGHASFGSVATVSLGKNVSNFGGYVGTGNQPISGGSLNIADVNSFDKQNRLPFHKATRFSLFLFDGTPPVFGSLDK